MTENKPDRPNFLTQIQSEHVDKIALALAKAQGSFEVAIKNKDNPYYKSSFSDLTELIKSSRKHLTENSLSVSSMVYEDEKKYLIMQVTHASGQFFRTIKVLNPVKPDIQSFSAYLSYAERILYSKLLCLSSSDDDGEFDRIASEAAKPPVTEKIGSDQLKVLQGEIKNNETLIQGIKNAYKISSLSQIPKSDFNKVYARLKELNKQAPLS